MNGSAKSLTSMGKIYILFLFFFEKKISNEDISLFKIAVIMKLTLRTHLEMPFVRTHHEWNFFTKKIINNNFEDNPRVKEQL